MLKSASAANKLDFVEVMSGISCTRVQFSALPPSTKNHSLRMVFCWWLLKLSHIFL